MKWNQKSITNRKACTSRTCKNMFTLNDTIPSAPIQLLCRHYNIIRVPESNNNRRNSWRRELPPRQRWRLLELVEVILVNSVPADYRRRNRDRLTEVGSIIERTLFASARNSEEYLSVRTLHARVSLAVTTHASEIRANRWNASRYWAGDSCRPY